MSAILEANLRALATRDPALAARIAAATPAALDVATAPTGAPTATAGDVLLASRQDPAEEARRWARQARERLAAAGPEATAVVLGFGLGHHVVALAAAWAGPVVVIEPDVGLLRAALALVDGTAALARATVCAGAPDEAVVDAWTAPVLLPHGPSLLRDAGALRAVRDALGGRLALRGLRLRVLVVSPLYGGSHPITGYCARALAGLGHDVEVLDLAPFAEGMHAIPRFTPTRAGQGPVREAFARFLATGVLAAVDAHQPDLLLAMAQAPLDAATLEAVRQRGVVTAFWFVEDHRVLPYWRDVIGGYDHFFGIQAEPFLTEARALTSGTVSYLPLAADPAVHRPVFLPDVERAELAAPVAFVGAGYRNRRVVLRSLLDLGLRVWGTEWEGAGVVEAAVQRGGARIPTDDCVRIFNATDVNVNLHSSTWVDGVDPRGDYVNPRTFELAACGAFQLVDDRALLPACFVPDHEVTTFATADALRDAVRDWLGRPDARRAQALRARERVLAEHTYRHRMQTLLAQVAGRDAARFRTRPRRATTGEVAAREGDSPLGRFLGSLPPETPFTLDGVVAEVQRRSGDLAEPEAVFLFLHQFDELYVKEARA